MACGRSTGESEIWGVLRGVVVVMRAHQGLRNRALLSAECVQERNLDPHREKIPPNKHQGPEWPSSQSRGLAPDQGRISLALSETFSSGSVVFEKSGFLYAQCEGSSCLKTTTKPMMEPYTPPRANFCKKLGELSQSKHTPL